ncbi:MAG: hypothetical protein ACQET5_02565 [Halobacteriota archaeon]|uniref:DUF7856 family protein n=1 Tax=Natronomonas sp. TaxID=2184060 RepID=UPI003974B6AD
MTLYDHVRVIAPGLPLRRADALAAAARSLDIETSVDAERRELRAKLETCPDSVPSRTDVWRRVAESITELDAKRERVATLRGRLQEAGDEQLEGEYRDAIRELSEAETEHVAAKEALADVRSRARTVRDTRERRLRLEDRLENLRRTARRERRDTVEPMADAAVAAVPGCEVGRYADADPISAALALVRIGRIELPIVLACSRFETRRAAERWLDASVHRVDPSVYNQKGNQTAHADVDGRHGRG